MKTYTLDKAGDDNIEKAGIEPWAGEIGISLKRRAGRILRVKIYFMFHDRSSGRPINPLEKIINAFPAEGKILLSFVFSVFILSVLLSCHPASRHFAIYNLFTGTAGFMVAMAPVILLVISTCLLLSALNRLAVYYIEWCTLPQK